ncbi:hypothetical protein QMG61_04585 [Cryobacterium sp. PH31-AA6]|uniref:hypothetical protein n=1 Tax=Cryobacterium sp. PH31-AA6 TaxID=3046205 RepID=UPI0024B95B03|nr:hypothetical protein [Cryobacterium sp. PH31-AA6]MDJ0323040.1 hypothetical protein [Cryobacterium sp. PH31-AA6]
MAEWWIYLGAPPSTRLSPAPTNSLSSDSERIALVKEAARLPDVTTAQLLDSSMTIRVERAESVVGAVTWLRGEPALGFKWVYVGDSAAWSVAIDVSDGQGVSDQTVAAIATFVQAHPRLELTVTSSLVAGVVPTKAEARALLAELQRTAADSSNQKVLLWWPDGNGTKVSGQVGSALVTH